MSTLVNRDLPPIPVDSNSPGEHDPFRDNNSHNPRNFDMVSLDTEQNYSNPFSNHDKPTETSNESSSDQDFESVEDRFRRNEKNRIRTLRSKPRFHYTRLPYFTIVVTLIQVIVFIVELVRMRILTGSAFQTQPYFNPMLGPSTYLLINMGARYVPCMHQVLGITNDTTISFPCANSTTVDTYVCNLAELCGLSGIPIEKNAFIPDQWYRIFIPIFLHAGFLHIIFNLLLQVTMGGSIERNIGILKYAIIYIASGIAGFLLGANFTPVGIASTGASGALFGIVATNMILFVYTGKKNTNMYGTKHYTLFIFIMIGEIVVSFVLGLLPGLDNFSHIGGFAMGILMAIVFLKDPYWVYVDGIIVYRKGRDTLQQFIDHWNPMYAIEDKIRTRFYIWIGARVVAFALAIVYFAVLIKNFFKSGIDRGDTCHWCKYINCIPVHGWCDVGQVTVSEVNSPTGTATATPTPTETPETSMVQKTITTVLTSGDSLPSSIENSSGHKRDVNANYDVFQASPVVPRNQIDPGDGFVHQQGVGIGIGIYMIIAMFTFGFLKRKKVI
ncbi:uncharacterized protein SPAPADRAFT_61590 [Spathaspora passalidarum NRRL Y-27907]|uniref:Rhomboid-type serine protease n=1 Tax=Spathaspora passalidarum (strain NRRL Y-27907 / 11-Y1) TaxID=619300 RepID=G3ANJ5_SPAPN|nr:uncharacterized protein SPAPADRAFT_61590 [Spathaspora passalidarum NRRL Y-27907]EGW32524.1 hypothetical protein SPAPADRAFT_61590 [Spathaspora passalidarum NRRL Y-27907]